MRKIILIILITILSINNINVSQKQPFIYSYEINYSYDIGELLYDNVWGTIYHAEKNQCDDTPTITGDGSIIDPKIASRQRWIAICQEMLDNQFRVSLLGDTASKLFKGKIKYGDTIWVESPNKNLTGWWIVHDTKNKRVKNSIDFLQTKGDESLYAYNKLWCGRFNNIQIYVYSKTPKLTPKKIWGCH